MRRTFRFFLLLYFAGAVQGQLPFDPKFLAGGLEDSRVLEAQRDALNLHEGDDASVSLAAPAPIAINCTARGTEFKATLVQKGANFRPKTGKCSSLSINLHPRQVRCICTSESLCCLGRCRRAAVRLRVRGRRRGERPMGGVWRSDRTVPDGLARVQGGAHRGHHRP
jgi:hypothetical protein